jgi:hypothetical protein
MGSETIFEQFLKMACLALFRILISPKIFYKSDAVYNQRVINSADSYTHRSQNQYIGIAKSPVIQEPGCRITGIVGTKCRKLP